MDFIQGEKFTSIADNKKIFYRHTHDVNNFFRGIDFSDDFILVSHNSDGKVLHSSEFPNANVDLIPKNLKLWFAQNVCVENDRIVSIPIGMENSMWFSAFGVNKIEAIVNKKNEDKNIKKLVYINHNVQTNPKERQIIYDIFDNCSFATCQKGGNGQNFNQYIDNIYNHKFVICPEGNGTDTHRTWETLYLGSIPIEKRNINNSQYTDLPICFVNDWSDINEEFLNSEYNRIKNSNFNYEKLSFRYWSDRIKNSI